MLNPGGMISGTVVLSSGEPVEGWIGIVRAEPKSATFWEGGTSVSSEGVFEFGGLAPGVYVILASDNGEFFGIMSDIRVEGGTEVTDLTMVLRPAAKVRVRLEGEEDAAGFRVLQHGVPVGYDWFREGRESIVPVSPGPCLVELLSAADGAVLEEREVFTSLGEVADVMFRRSE